MLRIIFSLLVVVLFSTDVYAVTKDEQIRMQMRRETDPKYAYESANNIGSKLVFIKELRSGLCFAIYFGVREGGADIITNVPCEKIPPSLRQWEKK